MDDALCAEPSRPVCHALPTVKRDAGRTPPSEPPASLPLVLWAAGLAAAVGYALLSSWSWG